MVNFHSSGVGVATATTNLSEVLLRLLLGQPFTMMHVQQSLVHITPRAQLHDQEQHRRCVNHFVEADHVRVLHELHASDLRSREGFKVKYSCAGGRSLKHSLFYIYDYSFVYLTCAARGVRSRRGRGE